MQIALWVVQALLAIGFILAGIMKVTQPIETLQKNMAWTGDVPSGLVRFIGVVELLGAVGLILPGVTHILPVLTAAAAGGFALDMVLASGFHITRKEYSMIGANVILLLLALFILAGRVAWVPLS